MVISPFFFSIMKGCSFQTKNTISEQGFYLGVITLKCKENMLKLTISMLILFHKINGQKSNF